RFPGSLPERARQEPAQQLRLLLHLDQEGVVTVVRGEIAIGYIAVPASKRADDFERLVARIQPVRRETDHQETGPDSFEQGGKRSALGEVERVHGPGNVQIRIGVKS